MWTLTEEQPEATATSVYRKRPRESNKSVQESITSKQVKKRLRTRVDGAEPESNKSDPS